jgi:uncharacterized damage-inducible protein DinB
MFLDTDLPVRPRADDRRGRSVREQMVHQCVSEDTWFRMMFGIDPGTPPLPPEETRTAFIRHYAGAAVRRLEALRSKPDAWWEEETGFFKEIRSRAWIMVRRIAHTAHHRGQQMAMLRMLGREIHSNYGPTADTGGLAQNQAPVIYAYSDLDAIVSGAPPRPLPGGGEKPVSERPDAV